MLRDLENSVFTMSFYHVHFNVFESFIKMYKGQNKGWGGTGKSRLHVTF